MYRVPLIFKVNGKNLFPKLILRAPFGNLYCCHSICHPSLEEDNFSVKNKLLPILLSADLHSLSMSFKGPSQLADVHAHQIPFHS